MTSRSAGPTEVPTSAAERRWLQAGRAAHVDRMGDDRQRAALALAFAVRCHAGQRRSSDDAPFIEHPLEVARLLRGSGCSDILVAAGLLHHVVTNAEVSSVELARRFGAEVARLVAAVGNDPSVHSYRRRKQVLRERVHGAGADAAVLLAADRISRLRELPAQVIRDRARFDEAAPGSRASIHLEYFQQMRVEHFHRSLTLAQRVAPRHPLVQQLADELENCPVTLGREAVGGHAATGPGNEAGRR